MKFYLLLFVLSVKMGRAARRNPVFRQFIRDKQLKFTIKDSRDKKGRQYVFSKGKIFSSTAIDGGDAAMVWCDGDTAFKAMASGNDEAVVAALTEKKLTIEGDFREFMWFARALDLMTKA